MTSRSLTFAFLLGTAIAVTVSALPHAETREASHVALPAPITDDAYPDIRLEESRLGQLLFYDPILSGNREVACATCHHPAFGTSDGLSLGLGDGGIGLGTARIADPENLPEERVARNSSALFNLAANEFVAMFHDGRIEADPSRLGGLRTPLDDEMVQGFASLLSAQSMFPVLSPDEMAGHYSENEISRAVRQGVLTGEGGAWDLIARRVAGVPEYATGFAAVYPPIAAGNPIAFTDISNAIAAFVAYEFRSDTSPFDAVLRGDAPFEGNARTGAGLFYGDAGCAACHTGPFLTDQRFHATATPQIGPGKVARFEGNFRDEGRFRVTGNHADLYAFRTPSLRNIALTAPYGHAGTHRTLSSFLAAHGQVEGLLAYDPGEAVLPDLDVNDTAILRDPDSVAAIATAAETWSPPSDDDITALVAFLETLTDSVASEGRLGIPAAVPSGLPVPRP